MNEITRLIDNMFDLNSAFFKYDPISVDSLAHSGFKSVIKRPHNLIEVRDKNGECIAQKIEVVTTPFTKEDVKVSIKNNTLTVSCGTENKEDLSCDTYIHRGISMQSYMFSLSIPNTIDKSKIEAVNKDGILTINMPLKSKKELESDEVIVKIK